jgi:hypothetical protein
VPIPDPLDEYPIHQAPLSMRFTAGSDRNFYDRCIMHAFPLDGTALLILGLGVYPNLGVMDAFASFRCGSRQVVVRCSDVLGDRMSQRVGPIRLEVLEPLRRLRAICDAPELGLAFDLTFDADFEAAEEPLHVMRTGARVTLEGCRFVQLGHWEGQLLVEGAAVDLAEGWTGDRDRSWGIRPVGEPEPAGRPQREPEAGIWWVWAPTVLGDQALVVIAQEDVRGHRTLNHAVRLDRLGAGPLVPSAGSSDAEAQLGWPRFDISYRPGTRAPERVEIHLSEADGRPVRVAVEPIIGMSLNIGCGYGADPEWSHGLWKGPGWVEAATYDLTDPSVAGRSAFSIVDYTARFRCGDLSGVGIFEHGCIGRHDPSGFAGWESMEASL